MIAGLKSNVFQSIFIMQLGIQPPLSCHTVIPAVNLSQNANEKGQLHMLVGLASLPQGCSSRTCAFHRFLHDRSS